MWARGSCRGDFQSFWIHLCEPWVEPRVEWTIIQGQKPPRLQFMVSAAAEEQFPPDLWRSRYLAKPAASSGCAGNFVMVVRAGPRSVSAPLLFAGSPGPVEGRSVDPEA